MSFREKSAWAMCAIMLVTGLFYANLVVTVPEAPLLGPLVPYVLAVIVLSIIAHIVLAIASPRDASAPTDEREALAIDRAGHWSGTLLGAGVVLVVGLFISGIGATQVMQILIGALIVSSFVEYALQIWFFRRGTV